MRQRSLGIFIFDAGVARQHPERQRSALDQMN